ncbi:chromate transporter [Acinetobacter sp. MD2(2019)]|uniref:chromate transporter n=1 Tax=Acinetobacter sp. MD2(2019) TaxID=2605273 RepID=UPI002D1F3BCD|nr:chromate transporter [Acinetobacter sp. MD2(2019)]MEB3753902.1 chromate transporter [Acinetobacter sp. MD2(2019)]
MNPVLLALFCIFTKLSLLAFGGGVTVLPEMRHQVVDVHHWLSNAEFSAMFALSQAAPGPNMMISPLIGWHVAGFSGLAVTTVAKFAPSSIVTLAMLHYWNRFQAHPFRALFEYALKPITVGMVLVSAYFIAQPSLTHLSLVGIMLFTTLLGCLTKLHPMWLMLIGAVCGVLFLA